MDSSLAVAAALAQCRGPPRDKWRGACAIHALLEPHVVAADGARLLGQLLAVVELESTAGAVLTSSIETVAKLCSIARSDQTLAREVLTPHLQRLFAALLAKIEPQPLAVLPFLAELVALHPTAARTVATKVRRKVHALLGDIDSESRAYKRTVFAALVALPLVERETPELVWAREIDSVVREVVRLFCIFDSFLAFDGDESLKKSLDFFQVESESIFPALSVSVGNLATFDAIAARLETALVLLEVFATSPTPITVKVPIGKLAKLAEFACSINTNILGFRPVVRDASVKDAVVASLGQCHALLCRFLAALTEKFGPSLVLFWGDILASVELLVPMNGLRVDRQCVLSRREELSVLLATVASFAKLVGYIQDGSLQKFAETAIILLEGETLDAVHQKTVFKAASSVRLASILGFFECLVVRATPTPNIVQRLVRWLSRNAVRFAEAPHLAQIADLVSQIIGGLLVYQPRHGDVLVLLATKLQSRDGAVHLLINPRLPAVSKAKDDFDGVVEEDEEEKEEEEKEEKEEGEKTVEFQVISLIAKPEAGEVSFLDVKEVKFQEASEAKIQETSEGKIQEASEAKVEASEAKLQETSEDKVQAKESEIEAKIVDPSAPITFPTVTERINETAQVEPDAEPPAKKPKIDLSLAKESKVSESDDSEFEMPEIALSLDEE